MPLSTDIQQAINSAIAAPDFKPPLPKLEMEVWSKVLDWKTHKLSNNCLEWLGDGLMYAAISVELYRQVPKGTPDMFTKIRGPIVTNQTFALLTHKLNIPGTLNGPNPRSLTAKCFADLFEVLPAEVYMRQGFDVLRDWVAQVFGPLIRAAVSAYERQPVLLNKKRKRTEDQDNNARLCNKRQKTVHVNFDSPLSELPRLADPATLKEKSSASSGPERPRPPHSVLRDTPSISPSSTQRKNHATLSVKDAPTKSRAAEKPLHALSEISRNIASSSRDLKHIGRVQSSRQAKQSMQGGQQPAIVAHYAAWQYALGRAPDSKRSGLEHAVLSSPSRYTAAAPSAPACGPGSSRFDPIIIDDEEDGLENTRNATGGSPREVIELLDDDDSAPELEVVENILAPLPNTSKKA